MRIEELHIERFGKIEDRSIQFEAGLNVIYGENEAGKTTLQAFIKAMFYGLNAKRKSIRDNERKRYLPWSGERASGTLIFADHDGIRYLIKKSFGTQKRQDEQTIFHCITGQEAVHIDFEKPGEAILGIGEEAFEKTVCIKQLSSQIIRDKEDEIMQRLTNLQQTGDEDISYHKAVEALLEVKKRLENQRRTGKLDELRVHRERLREEYREAAQRHEEMIEDEIQLKEWEAEKLILLQQIKELEEKKERIRKYKLYQEHKKLTDCQQRIHLLSEEKKQLERLLMRKGEMLPESFLSDLQDKHSLEIQFKKDIDAMKTNQRELEEEIAAKQLELERLDTYKDLSEHQIDTLLSYHHENKLLQERLEQISKSEKELRVLEKKLLEEEKKFQEISAAKEIEKDLETRVYQARDRLRSLQSDRSDGNAQKESLLLKKEILETKAKSISIQMGMGIVMILAGGIAGWVRHSLFYGLSIIGLLWCFTVFYQKGRLIEEINKIQKMLQQYEEDISAEEEIKQLTQFLKQAYQVFGAGDFESFQERAEIYRQEENHLNLFRTKIEAKRAQWDEKEYEGIQKKLLRQEEYINRILESCACQTVDEFLECRKNYTQIVIEKNNLEKQKKNLIVKLAEKQKKLEELERKILAVLEGLNIDGAANRELKTAIEQLSDRMARKKAIENEIDSLTKVYHAVLKNREETWIQRELETFIPEESDEFLGEEKDVDIAFSQKHQELFSLQGQISGIAHAIQKKEQEGKSITQLEEELSEINEEIQYGERKIKVINAALKGLENAFKEIQKDFGPKLNQKSGEILGRITKGKYNDLRISEDYQVRITDSVQREMREVDYFSNGTWDQIYLALRLGITQMIFEKGKRPFLLLDDALVQYDDKRLGAAWEYLHEYAKEHQVLMFTCQERDIEKAKQYEGTNLILL